ncbi:MAG: sulfate permease [Phycisphaeraceae bacterium]|nr:sulfate permease [Phycisphaeraceae bacterium]
MSKLFPSRFTPKLVTCLREGYSTRKFFSDATAGLTVAIIALPLAMALGIASIPIDVAHDLQQRYPSLGLSPPALGLYTAVVAGFLISALGGSRLQIGGPTAAFIPIVYGVASQYGYEGLATATVMAGVIVILMGLFRFGALIKFIPYPVTTGFTAGIAVTIAASQVKDFFGLTITDAAGNPASVPADFIPKLQVLAGNLGTSHWQTIAVGVMSLAILIAMRRLIPRIPGAIVAVAVSSGLVALLGWSQGAEPVVQTIGTRFGGIPSSLPPPHLPAFSVELIQKLIGPATTIALLCAIESLLSAVVADGMTGHRHRSDQELIAQGVANVASSCFFGLPATGAIARTVANIKSGGKTPIAGVLHALFIVVFMLGLAPLAKHIPLATLAAILLVVAWNISEIDHFRALLRAPRTDVLVLLTTFGLTVFTDLTKGVGVGMVLASLLFMKRMADVSNIAGIREEIEQGQETEAPDPKDPGAVDRRRIPPGVEVYEINGPFFFGVADRLKDTLNQFERPPKVFILRMRYVPHIDATGLHALDEFHIKCKRQGTRLLLGGVHAQPLFEFTRVGFDQRLGLENIFENLEDAIAKARQIVSPAGA